MARPKDKYAYTVEDIAKMTKQPANTVRQHISRGKFHPAELSSVVDYINSLNKPKYAIGTLGGYMSAIETEARLACSIDEVKQSEEPEKE